MKPPTNSSAQITRRIALGLLACLLASCTTVEKRNVKIEASPIPADSARNKYPLTAALVLDNNFKTYGVKHELVSGTPFMATTASYQVGGDLARYAEDVSRSLFREVMVFDSADAAKNKADIVLIPKAVRSDTHLGNPIYVMLSIEWQIKDRTENQTLWLATVDSQATEKPAAFGYKKHERIAYQRCFDELCGKTLKAFRESPEVSQLAAQLR